jgi:galactose mutarotase-like enzyme
MRYRWKQSESQGVQVVTLSDAGGPHTLDVAITPACGANILSLIFDGSELLHRGGDLSPEPRGGWDGKAPILWPAVGRQRYGAYSWPPGHASDAEITRHAMPLHGFAKDAAFQIISATANDSSGAKLCLRLHWRDVAAFAGAFPFEYSLDIEFLVYQNALTVVHTVENLSSSSSLPFAVGNHLSLRFPFRGPAYTGWGAGVLTASTTEQHELDSGSLLSGATRDRSSELAPGGSAGGRGGHSAATAPLSVSSRSAAGMRLDAPGALDGVFGLPPAPLSADAASRPCWMALSQPGALTVKVSHELRKPCRRLPVEAAAGSSTSWDEAAWRSAQDHRLFVLWGEPPPPPPLGGHMPLEDGSPGFVCVEPWQSGPDSLNTGLGLVVLAPAQRADWVFRVEVTEPEGLTGRP